MDRTLWLVGMMGAGKTTVAPLVAQRLGRHWVDTDAAVESTSGRSIVALLEDSVDALRAVERGVLTALADSGAVVACGGGVVTVPAMVETMRGSGLVVWLRATPDTLVERVGDGEGRPLLAGDPATALREIEAVRRPQYAAAAHRVVDCDDRLPEEVADDVVSAWLSS